MIARLVVVAEVEVEVTEVTVATRSGDEPNTESATEVVTERRQGIYASEASRPLTLEAMFERMREEERNTPEYLAKAEESYQEGKRQYMDYCRRKGVPHELENEPETLPQSEIAKFRAKTAETVKGILAALTRRNTKEKSPPKATSSRPSLDFEVLESREFHSSSESDEKAETRPRFELRSRNDPLDKEEIESEDNEEEDTDKFEDEELTEAIRERLRACRCEMYRENEPVEEEFKEVKCISEGLQPVYSNRLQDPIAAMFCTFPETACGASEVHLPKPMLERELWSFASVDPLFLGCSLIQKA